VDTSALAAGIAAANAAKAGVPVATNASDVARGLQYVTQGEQDTLTAAIAAAEAVKNDAEATQTGVNEAIEALAAAVAAFKTAKQNHAGTKTAGFNETEKTTLVQAATDAKSGVKISPDGSDIAPNEIWVAQAVLDSLNAAITALNGNLSDQTCLALATALNAFNEAKQAGKKAKELRLTGLPEAWNNTGIQFGLFTRKTIQGNPPVMGYGTIEKGALQAPLYSYTGGDSGNYQTPWNGSGTITVSVGGNPVPRLQIDALDTNNSYGKHLRPQRERDHFISMGAKQLPNKRGHGIKLHACQP
jgi:hypothetical protein